MLIHQNFINIERLKPENLEGFNKGDVIQISEKIDGANCAVRYDSETNSIVAQGRKNILDDKNGLRGFYQWTQNLGKDLFKSVLGENLVLFGEWLVPHTVKYPDDKYHTMYCYDVFDLKSGEYLLQTKVKEIISQLKLNYVPVFYEGEFISWEHCMSFVGKTKMGGDMGEGIVIKNQTRLNEQDKRMPFYIKIVDDKFRETQISGINKADLLEKLKVQEKNQALAETIVTKARIEKILNKFVDEGVLDENLNSEQMPVITKKLTGEICRDCIKEEPETVNKIEDFGRIAYKICIDLAKEIASERTENM